jgi:hypothetical protein
MPQKNLKTNFLLQKIDLRNLIIGFKYESQDRRCNFVLEEKLAELKRQNAKLQK